jgi:hypothetical protein
VLAHVDPIEQVLTAQVPDTRRFVGYAEPRLRHKPGLDGELHVGG